MAKAKILKKTKPAAVKAKGKAKVKTAKSVAIRPSAKKPKKTEPRIFYSDAEKNRGEQQFA